MKNPRTMILHSILKLGLAGGVIAAIALVIMTQDPTSAHVGPADATADITGLDFAPKTKSGKFTEAMVGLGMQPRVYDYNGNVMFFAVGQSKPGATPRDILRDVQQHLVDEGINEKNHADSTPLMATMRSVDWQRFKSDRDVENGPLAALNEKSEQLMLRGDVVPTIVTDDYVEMVGIDHDANLDFSDLNTEMPQQRLSQMMGGYKFIDATWDEATQRTEVTAVWPADGFDGERMAGRGQQSPPDPEVPACIGCTRDHRMQTLDDGDKFSSNMFHTNLDVQSTYDYYRQVMTQRGWQESGAQPMLNRMEPHFPMLADLQQEGRLLNFVRDGETMQLTVLREDDGTRVVSAHDAEGAQRMQAPPTF